MTEAKPAVQEEPAAEGESSVGVAAMSSSGAAASDQHAAASGAAQQSSHEPETFPHFCEAWRKFEPYCTAGCLRKFRRVFATWGHPGGEVHMERLRSLAWGGVPHEYRYDTWRLLLGYIPADWSRAQGTLERKREEYWSCVTQHYSGGARGQGYAGRTEREQRLLRDILVDLPRTMPTVPVSQTDFVQRALERVLYVWAVRHPASSYVQGINDLACGIIIAFLAPQVAPEGNDLEHVPSEALHDLEADAYWCLTRLLDRIQDSYTPTQPGIQRMVWQLRELTNRIDSALVSHLESTEDAEGLFFQKFAFRRMNCMMSREVSLPALLRLWDTYTAEARGFEEFHVYACAAMLLDWSQQLREMEFQDLVMFLQSPPSREWDVAKLQEVLAQAWVYKSTFANSHGHLS